jgi:hypothetical protein
MNVEIPSLAASAIPVLHQLHRPNPADDADRVAPTLNGIYINHGLAILS